VPDCRARQAPFQNIHEGLEAQTCSDCPESGSAV